MIVAIVSTLPYRFLVDESIQTLNILEKQYEIYSEDLLKTNSLIPEDQKIKV